MSEPFRDRHEAGRTLAGLLAGHAGRPDVLVLGLPRGGVPVAAEVAVALRAPLDVFLVRKLGVPGHEELAMGAIASGGVRVLNRDVIDDLGISEGAIEAVVAAERGELARRERLYRGTRARPDARGRTVILVDDGLATGSTMRAAIVALRGLDPARIVAAVPVAAVETCEEIRALVDEMVCARMPEPFLAVGAWYDDFSPTSDEEVGAALRRAAARGSAAPGAGGSPAGPGDSRSGAGGRGSDDPAVAAVTAVARPFGGGAGMDALLARCAEARFVLVGEASHGTHEFYEARAEITRRLITEHGFTAVAVEADWPDAYRVNRYVRAASADAGADAALAGFDRFPRWMWRNTVVRDFAGWLRAHNDERAGQAPKAGFYGLDLYSLHASIEAVVGYLETVDPEAAARARRRYGCFDHFGDDAQMYGYAASLGAAEPCEDAVVDQLLELQRRGADLATRGGSVAEDEHFFAEQNARLAKNAEAYYRAMFRGHVDSWNRRDRHMAETLDALVAHLDRGGGRAKVVVWAHNSHLGDARATRMGEAGEINLGQLVRERHGDQAYLVGFSTYMGTVTAASEWGAAAERKRVRPGLAGSYEALFHDAAGGIGEPFTVSLDGGDGATEHLRGPRPQRAIGVIYRPETERFSHYLEARLPDQFDALIHIDETRAVEPLEPTPGWTAGDAPETYPFAV